MEWIVAVVALVGMEVVLGIDNLVVLAIVTGKLPEQQRPLARRIGLLLALVMRIVMLFTITFLMRANQPVFYLTDIGFPSDWFAAKGELIHPESADEHFERLQNPTGEARAARYSYEVNAISVRDLIMILGGLFLIRSSVKEIHHKIEHRAKQQNVTSVSSFRGAIMQIAAFDMLFSFDSVITAVGMAEDVWVMVVAVVLAIAVMMMFADPISDFVNRNPTLAMLALSFLILIGVMLVAEGLGTHVNKKYIYFAMAFSLAVELLNLRAKSIESPTASPA